MINLCIYKDIFGKPLKGFHSIRIFNIALIDVLCVILFAKILEKYFSYNFNNSIIFLFLFGILLHRIFCVRTTIDKLLFN